MLLGAFHCKPEPADLDERMKGHGLRIGTGSHLPSLKRISDEAGAMAFMVMGGTEYIGGSLTAKALRVRSLSSAPLLLLVDPCRWEVCKRDNGVIQSCCKSVLSHESSLVAMQVLGQECSGPFISTRTLFGRSENENGE